MFVIVEIAGLQYKVEQDQKLYVNRLNAEEGEVISFDRVLLSNNGSVEVGAPVIDGLAVEAKVLAHLKGDKVIVYKKKRRKGYAVKNGFRAALTQIEIVSIGAGSGTAKNATAKKAAPKAEKPVDSKTEKAAAPKAEKAKAPKAEKAAAPKAEKATKETKATAAKKETKAATPKKAASKKGDDLTKVEGIGPKVKALFNDAGIVTFADLAAKKPADLKAILEPQGGIYAAMDPETWPKQAKLAADGKWDELKAWQDELNGGK